jgi:hypothetical protein
MKNATRIRNHIANILYAVSEINKALNEEADINCKPSPEGTRLDEESDKQILQSIGAIHSHINDYNFLLTELVPSYLKRIEELETKHYIKIEAQNVNI